MPETQRAFRGGLTLVVLAAAATGVMFGCREPGPAADDGVMTPATARYLAGLDVHRFERQGTDYTNPRYSPLRLGKPLSQLDIVYDYDFPRVQAVARSLEGVDRRTALAAVFGQVTRGCRTDTERHLAVLKFMHKAAQHNQIQPMWPDKSCVFDPLILLELGEMRCGHVNRVAVDLFRAAGYDGRLVQAGFHLSAEVYYDGGWHYFDGDIWGNGESVLNPDGSIPSINELSKDPARLDSLAAYWEPTWENSHLTCTGWHPSWFFFAAEAYAQSQVRPSYYVKLASAQFERESRHYGWEHCKQVDDPDRTLWPGLPREMIPMAPLVERCEVAQAGSGHTPVADLEWHGDPTAAGYVVFAGRRSRGWHYDTPDSLGRDVRRLKSAARGWRPEDYEARFALPPADVARVEVSGTRARVELPTHGGPVYVTVMAYDAHGRAAGRTVFPMSEELKLEPDLQVARSPK